MANRVLCSIPNPPAPQGFRTSFHLVGVENSVFYFSPQDPLREPAFLKQALAEQGMHLLLDLHNVYTTAQNVGF